MTLRARSTRKPVAFGYPAPDFSDYRLQVTTWASEDPTDYTARVLTFPNKPDAMAFAKRAGLTFTS